MAIQYEYKINNVVVPFNGTPPDPTKAMVLDDIACIGYPDVVDRTGCQFKVYTDITTEEEDTADFEEYMNCMLGGATALVDEDGNYLIDEDGNFIVEG